MSKKILVTGAGGFIGGHLCKFLRDKGHYVYGVDIDRHSWHNADNYNVFTLLDCRSASLMYQLLAHERFDHVYALAADMGGMGFISANHWQILSNNARININTALAASASSVERLFFSSSACVYPVQLQKNTEARYLKEDDAWQGSPEDAYGVEKLMAEQLYLRMGADTGCQIRIARFHNIFGPAGHWDRGREKLPAAVCRKIAIESLLGTTASPDPVKIGVWGDGQQTRSFCYIDDCVEMIYRLMTSDCDQPMNVGTDRMVSVNEIYDIVAEIAGISIQKVHDLSKPQGVRGRNANLTLMRRVLGYEPQVSLEKGLQRTYMWIRTKVGA